MTNQSLHYIKAATRTESIPDVAVGNQETRLLHAAMGLSTESAELLDVLKKHVFYGKPIDYVNLIEEAGDLFWYLAILCDTLGVSFERVQEINIAKLQKRYPEKFSSDSAINRDLAAEREILEGGAK